MICRVEAHTMERDKLDKEEHNIKDKPKCKLPKEYKVAIAVKKMKAAK